MTDDLEAQARKFVTKSWPYKGTTDVKVRAALTWARRLVAESRAGALTHEAIDRMARAMYAAKYPKQAHFYDSAREKTREEYRAMVRAAIAAEAEPGEQG